MENSFNNINSFERIYRLVLGCALLGMVVLYRMTPTWIALIATYPVLTSITAWDPFYAVFIALRKKVASTPRRYKKLVHNL